jgi:hypothetical protein
LVGGLDLMEKCRPSKHETLSSIPVPIKKKKIHNKLEVRIPAIHKQKTDLLSLEDVLPIFFLLLRFCSLNAVSGLLGGILPLEPFLQPFWLSLFWSWVSLFAPVILDCDPPTSHYSWDSGMCHHHTLFSSVQMVTS